MPRTKVDRRTVGGRPYTPYSDDELQQCLSDIQSGKLTQRKASAVYKIPRSTLILKLKAIKTNSLNLPGRKCVFTQEEENAFVQHVITMCDFGFPLTALDLRCIIKTYLDSSGRKEERFKNNFPGKRWVEGFMTRHKGILSKRLCSNIKRCRAAVDDSIINTYFDNLQSVLEGVPPCAIWNYDETNLVDDPGKKIVLTKRGCKYPEAIKNSTKAAVSIMVCGNAAGELCPPYVNYKAEKMWDTWTEGGPDGARFNRTKSGWFDACSFEDWFTTVLFPRIKRSPVGKHVVIGDNLSSHISPKVLKLCKDNNIAFVALPPNATHLTQPLDISFFRPFKIHWRAVLDDWKTTPAGRRHPTIPKDIFPSLLRKLYEKIGPNSASNLQSGFRKAGLYPLNRQQVLQKIPNSDRLQSNTDLTLVDKSFTDFLQATRLSESTPKIVPRKKKVNVEAGTSIAPEDIHSTASDANGEPRPGPSGNQPSPKPPGRQPLPGIRRQRNKQKTTSDSDSEESSGKVSLASKTESEDLNDHNSDVSLPSNQSQKLSDSLTIGDYVIIRYEENYWPGIVEKLAENGVEVSCMEKVGKLWKWPSMKDVLQYEANDVVMKICKPKQVSKSRLLYSVPELERFL